MAHTHFPDVKDFSDPDFNRDSKRAVWEAQYQRAREVKVAIEELRVLQEQLFQCYYRHAPDHYTACKDLATEYKSRVVMSHSIPSSGHDSVSRLRRTTEGSLVVDRK